MTTLDMVDEFHEKFVVAAKVPIDLVKSVRPVLIREELKELNESYWSDDKVGILDALTDTQYVLDGTFIVYDLSKPEAGVAWFTKHKYDNTAMLETLNRFDQSVHCEDIIGIMSSLYELQWRLDSSYIALDMMKFKQVAFEEVHRSNMAKVDANGNPIIRADGKILKPEGWQPPNLKQFFPQ